MLLLSSNLQKLPPFGTSWREVIEDIPAVVASHAPVAPVPPVPPVPKVPGIRIETPDGSYGSSKDDDVVISIDKNGVRITPRAAHPPAASAASGASRAAGVSSAPAAAASPASGPGSRIHIALPG